jgi:hypothetical protein
MIHNTPPQLSQERVDQMIHTALSLKQDEKKSFWDFLKPLMKPPVGFGIGASLATASIIGLLWLSPTTTPNTVTQETAQKPLSAREVNDMMLYDLLEDLS